MDAARSLLQKARHPAIDAAYAYWRRVQSRKGRSFPSRADLDPTEMRTFLRYVVLIDVVRDGANHRFRYRLAGTHLVDILGEEVTGKYLEDTGWGPRLGDAHRLLSTVVEEKLVFGVSRSPISELLRFEHLTLPLSSHHPVVDTLFGVRCALPSDAWPADTFFVSAPLALEPGPGAP